MPESIFDQSFDRFLQEDAEEAISKASGSCESLYVEIHEDSYALLWSGEIGNRYDSPGVIVLIPARDEDEDEDLAIQSLKDLFEQGVEELSAEAQR